MVSYLPQTELRETSKHPIKLTVNVLKSLELVLKLYQTCKSSSKSINAEAIVNSFSNTVVRATANSKANDGLRKPLVPVASDDFLVMWLDIKTIGNEVSSQKDIKADNGDS